MLRANWNKFVKQKWRFERQRVNQNYCKNKKGNKNRIYYFLFSKIIIIWNDIIVEQR